MCCYVSSQGRNSLYNTAVYVIYKICIYRHIYLGRQGRLHFPHPLLPTHTKKSSAILKRKERRDLTFIATIWYLDQQCCDERLSIRNVAKRNFRIRVLFPYIIQSLQLCLFLLSFFIVPLFMFLIINRSLLYHVI